MEGKSRWFSKTIGLGVIMTLASVVTLVAGEEWVQQYPSVVSALGLIAGLLTLVFRHYTIKPLKPL